MKRKFIARCVLIAGALAACSTHASENEKIQKVAKAIKEADRQVVLLVFTLASCKAANPPMSHTYFSLHRDMAIAAITRIFRDRNKALIRYDDLMRAASSGEKRSDGALCVALLDEFQNQLDIAIAKLDESYR